MPIIVTTYKYKQILFVHKRKFFFWNKLKSRGTNYRERQGERYNETVSATNGEYLF